MARNMAGVRRGVLPVLHAPGFFVRLRNEHGIGQHFRIDQKSTSLVPQEFAVLVSNPLMSFLLFRVRRFLHFFFSTFYDERLRARALLLCCLHFGVIFTVFRSFNKIRFRNKHGFSCNGM